VGSLVALAGKVKKASDIAAANACLLSTPCHNRLIKAKEKSLSETTLWLFLFLIKKAIFNFSYLKPYDESGLKEVKP